MKNILLIVAVALCSVTCKAQGSIKYCDLIVSRPFLKNYTAELHIDSNTNTRRSLLRDAHGDKLKFASPADALNYVARQGWELAAAYHDRGETHYLLKK